MKKFVVGVSLEVSGFVTVEAQNAEEANEIVQREMDEDEAFLLEHGDISHREVLVIEGARDESSV